MNLVSTHTPFKENDMLDKINVLKVVGAPAWKFAQNCTHNQLGAVVIANFIVMIVLAIH